MCEYCDSEYYLDNEPLTKTDKNTIGDVIIADNGYLFYLYSDAMIDYECEYHINYCPMCGRKLNE